MEKKFILRLFEYNGWRWSKYWEQIEKGNKGIEIIEKDLGLPFKSIKGTMNHILLADYLWIMRMKNKPSLTVPFNSEDFQYPKTTYHYGNLVKLWQSEGDFHSFFEENSYEWFKFHQERVKDCNWKLSDLVKKAPEEDLNKDFSYRDSKGAELKKNRSDVFYHLANHSTHHFGQISVAFIKEFGQELFPETDYTYFLDSLNNN